MIKYIAMDIDGSLTDGKIYMGNDGESVKAFSIKDGYAVNYILRPAGIEPIVITGRTSKIVENRCRELGIEKVYQGKTEKLSTLIEAMGEQLDSCAYFGDDVLDLACMIPVKQAGGIVGCPFDAVKEVKAVADYVCTNKAGEGALREFSEWLIGAHLEKRVIEKRVRSAIEYLSKLDMKALAPGRYYVDDTFSYSVQEYETKSAQQCLLESHKKYIDIQWIVEGREEVDVANIAGLDLSMNYNETKDIMFWKQKEDMMKIFCLPGSCIVLYPKDAHMGCIQIDGPTYVKKIVGKVKAN